MNKIAEIPGHRRVVTNLPVLDESNHRLFDLIFATGSVGMKNVTSDLKNKLGKIKTKNFREINEVMAGPQKQLTSC
jgi:hypothetical protein